MNIGQKIIALQSIGFIVGDRDPRRNTAFKGRYMVAQPCDESLLPTECAATGGWCVVGDDLRDLVDDTFSAFETEIVGRVA